MTKRVRSSSILAVTALLAASAAGAQTFYRTLGTDSFESAHAVVPTRDGGTLVLASTASASGDAWLWRLDPSGATLWQETLGGPDHYEQLVDGVELDDGSFMLVGHRARDVPDTPWETWIVLVDATGSIVFQDALGSPGQSFITRVVERTAGGFVVGGSVFSDGFSAGVVVRLDAGGRVVAGMGLTSLFTRLSVSSLLPTADGGVLIAGGEDGDLSFGAFVAKLASDLSVTWQRSSPAINPTVIAEVPGGYVLGGSGPTIVQLDGTGSLVDCVRSGDPWAGPFEFVPTAGGVVLTGRLPDASFEDDLVVADVALDGTVRWNTTFGGPGSDTGRALAPVPGGYVIAGTIQPHGRSDAEIVALRLDAAGGGAPACGVRTAPLILARVPASTDPRSHSAFTFVPTRGTTFAVATLTTATPEQPCFDCVADAYEPDDDCGATQRTIRDGETQRRSFCEDADDWARLALSAGTSITLWTEGLETSADTVVFVVAPSCGAVLASDDDSGGGGASRLSWTAPTDGTYLVHVEQKDRSIGADRGYALGLLTNAPACTNFVVGWPGSGGSFASAHALADGSLLAAGTADYRACIVRTTSSGVVTSQVLYETDGSAQVAEVIPTRDGGALLAGTRDAPGGAGLPSAWLLKTDASGAVEWSRTYHGERYNEAIGVAETATGYAVAISDQTEVPSLRTFLRVLGVDGSGAPVWQRDFADWPGGIYLRSACPHAGGIAVLVEGWLASGDRATWVLALDGSGTVAFQTVLSGESLDLIADVVSSSDGGLFVVGSAYDVATRRTYGAAVTRLDASGAVSWSRRYSQVAGLYLQDRSATATPDGGLVISGRHQWSTTQLWMARVDAAGNLAQEVLPASDLDLSVRAMALTPAGDLVVAGGGLDVHGGVIACLTPDLAFPAGCTSPTPTSSVAEDLSPTITAGVAPTTRVTIAVRDVLNAFEPEPFPSEEVCACASVRPPPLEVSPPGAAAPLIVRKWDLRWEDGARSGSDTFDLYRGVAADLRAGGTGGSCLASGLTLPSTTDAGVPPPGAGFWFYLVGGRNPSGTGTLGSGTFAVRVPLVTCP